MWDEERSNPDDIGILETQDTIFINKVYESKISLHALQRSKTQRNESMITIINLVNALNGSHNRIKSEAGRRIITESMENLFEHCDLPIEMSPHCEYCYILPLDQKYVQNPREPKLFETLNVPLSTAQIEYFRGMTIGFFESCYGR